MHCRIISSSLCFYLLDASSIPLPHPSLPVENPQKFPDSTRYPQGHTFIFGLGSKINTIKSYLVYLQNLLNLLTSPHPDTITGFKWSLSLTWTPAPVKYLILILSPPIHSPESSPVDDPKINSAHFIAPSKTHDSFPMLCRYKCRLLTEFRRIQPWPVLSLCLTPLFSSVPDAPWKFLCASCFLLHTSFLLLHMLQSFGSRLSSHFSRLPRIPCVKVPNYILTKQHVSFLLSF